MGNNLTRAENALVRTYLQKYPAEAARTLENRSEKEIASVLEGQPVLRALGIMNRLTPDTASRVVQVMTDEASGSVLSRMEPNRCALLLSRMDGGPREHLLSLLDESLARELEELQTYPPDSAGRLMDARVTNFRPEMRVDQTLRRLRDFPRTRIQEIYVIDEEGRLLGSVPLQELAVSRPKDRLQRLYRPAPAAVQPVASREEVVEILSQLPLTALPVVDHENRLLGVLRQDALAAAAAEELSADIQTMVGASKEEKALSKVVFAVRKRLPWLEINLGTAFLAAAVVGLFEETIARFTALAVLLPVVAGQSGNTGAQALAVVMRGLALREVRIRHWPRLLSKEVMVGLLNGIVVALTTSFFVFMWSRSVGLALVIGLSMVASMAIAGLAGAAIPLLLTALRQDPAQSSSIILTTVTDVAGFFSFLGIATMLSGML